MNLRNIISVMKEVTPISQETRTGVNFYPEMIVVFGRGLAVSKNADGTLNFRPTPLLENMDLITGSRKPFRDFRVDLDPEGKGVVAAGGNSNVLGVVHFLVEKETSGPREYPKKLIFAAGRPKYLRDISSSVSEGEIMKGRFDVWANYYHLSNIDVTLLTENRQTWDDVRVSLGLAQTHGCKKVGIIVVGPHVERTWELVNKFVRENPETLESFEKVQILDSWEILKTIHPLYKKVLEFVETTGAYKNIMKMERNGIEAIRNGTYIPRET